MLNVGGKLDRHKVCACYMYAIIRADVLRCRLADSAGEECYLALNENLAITTGLSLLRAFAIASIVHSKRYTDEEKEEYRKRIDNGIIYPKCNYGDYRSSFAAELHYTRMENSYNVLSLANTLFLLETNTLRIEEANKQEEESVAASEKRGGILSAIKRFFNCS